MKQIVTSNSTWDYLTSEPVDVFEAVNAIVAKIKANEPRTKEKDFEEWQKKAPPFTQQQLREWRKYAK